MHEPYLIPLLAPADYQAGSQDLDSINMGRLHRVGIGIIIGAVTGNDATVQLYSGATAGTKTTALAFEYRLTTVDIPGASADVLGARVAVAAGSTITFSSAGDWNARMIQIDVMSDQMTEGEPWLTVATDDGSASALFLAAFAVAWPRYGGDTPPTAL